MGRERERERVKCRKCRKILPVGKEPMSLNEDEDKREREGKRVAEYKPSFLTDFRMFNKRHQRVCGFHKSENVNSAFSSAEKACRSLRRVENVPSCITGIKIANCAMDCLPAPSLSLSVSVSMYIYVPVCTYVYTYRRSSLSAIRLVFESLRVLTRE